MIRTWFAKGRGKFNNVTVYSSKYFIEHECLSCGWAEPYYADKVNVKDFDTYKQKWIEINESRNWNQQGVHHLFETLQKGDFVQTRLDGIYYLAQIPEDPIKLFNIDDRREAIEYDCVIQLKNIKWIKVGKEDSVPGSVSSFRQNRNSLFKIDNYESSIQEYTATSIFSARIMNPNIDLTIKDRDMIFNLLGPDSLEDLVALWLYDKYNYITILSTNKLGTQTYEFVLVDGTKHNNEFKSKKRIYIQAKNGDVSLYTDNYKHLLRDFNDEVWLVTRGKVDENIEDQIVRLNYDNGDIIKNSYYLNELRDFIFNTQKNNLLPDKINRLLTFFSETNI